MNLTNNSQTLHAIADEMNVVAMLRSLIANIEANNIVPQTVDVTKESASIYATVLITFTGTPNPNL